eukprot:TRINITY_DN551_c0_g1_i2.p1 TRINITY_DN551_c0_g1~~TRINITY_DN551_c0_g1_i2.p1  ORF type:complete len:211 (+),score=18.24 TRINITY_DN551_c0_g1_i2:447-1079(+)
MSRVLDTDEAVLPSFTKLLADDAIDSKTVPDSSVVLPDFALISGSAPTLTGDTQDGGSRPTSQTSGSSEQGCPDIDTESDGDSVSDPGEIAKRAQARVRRRSSSVGKPPGVDLEGTQNRKHSVVLATISEQHGESSTTYQLARHNRVGENGWSDLAQFHDAAAEDLDTGYAGRYARYRDSLDRGIDYPSVQADATEPNHRAPETSVTEDS